LADNFRFAQLQSFSLNGSGAIIGDTSITLKEMLSIDGAALVMATDFGTIGFGTLEPNSGTNEEQISFTGLTNNSNGTVTLTGVKNVGFTYPYTQTVGLSKTHAGSTVFVISNTSGFYDKFTAKDDDETITGQWTFNNFPITPATQLATDVVAGFTKLSLAASNPLDPIAVGTNDTRLDRIPMAYAVDSAGTDAYAITPSPAITAYSAGLQSTFKAGTLNTGAATLNISGLGAKIIKKAGLFSMGDSTSQFDMTNPSGTTFRYTWDGTGTDPLITATSIPINAKLVINGANFAAGNNGTFVVTGSGANYFEVTNAGGVVEANKTLGAGSLQNTVTDLVTGDILLEQIVSVVYDGAYMQIVSKTPFTDTIDLTTDVTGVLPTANGGTGSAIYLFTSGAATYDCSSSGTLNIAHGLGKVPSIVRISASLASGAAAAIATICIAEAVYNGTTQNSRSTMMQSGSAVNSNYGNTNALFRLTTDPTYGNYITGVITWDATNIIITWTLTNVLVGTANILMEAH